MMDCAEKAQHLRRCSTHNLRYPRVACTIVWQPRAIKNTTPTALKHSIRNMNYVILRLKLWWIAQKSHRFYVNIPMNIPAILNDTMMQHHRFYVNIPMHICVMVNVTMMQLYRFYVIIPMNVCAMVNVIMMQLGTSCSFDSPGLARNEPTPGKRSQGDSTP